MDNVTPNPEARPSRRSQRQRILALLVQARGEWVALPKIIALSARYSARIWELRRMGFTIENRIQVVAGQRHSWFQLVPNPAPVQQPSPHLPRDASGLLFELKGVLKDDG